MKSIFLENIQENGLDMPHDPGRSGENLEATLKRLHHEVVLGLSASVNAVTKIQDIASGYSNSINDEAYKLWDELMKSKLHFDGWTGKVWRKIALEANGKGR